MPVRAHQSSADRKYNKPSNGEVETTTHSVRRLFLMINTPSCSLLCHVSLHCLVYSTVKMHCPIERGDFDRDTEQEEVHQPLTRQADILHSQQQSPETLIPAGRAFNAQAGPSALRAVWAGGPLHWQGWLHQLKVNNTSIYSQRFQSVCRERK